MNLHENYQLLIEERYSHLQDIDFQHRSDYLLVLNAPYHFRNEGSMLSYLSDHTAATLESMRAYLYRITAEGLSLPEQECIDSEIHKAYLDLLQKRYGHLQDLDYEHHGNYIWISQAPEHYLSEKGMFFFAKTYPASTMRDLLNFFTLITPDGLAPDDDGEDL